MSLAAKSMDAGLALMGLALIANVGFAILVWIYALLFVHWSVPTAVVGALFVALGALILIGYVRSYTE